MAGQEHFKIGPFPTSGILPRITVPLTPSVSFSSFLNPVFGLRTIAPRRGHAAPASFRGGTRRGLHSPSHATLLCPSGPSGRGQRVGFPQRWWESRTSLVLCRRRTRGDPGSSSQCLHLGNASNGTHLALEELSGNPLERAESGAHEAQRDAASGHPFSCERPAAFRARLPRGAAAGGAGCEFVRAKAGYRTEARARGPRAAPGPRPDGGR